MCILFTLSSTLRRSWRLESLLHSWLAILCLLGLPTLMLELSSSSGMCFIRVTYIRVRKACFLGRLSVTTICLLELLCRGDMGRLLGLRIGQALNRYLLCESARWKQLDWQNRFILTTGMLRLEVVPRRLLVRTLRLLEHRGRVVVMLNLGEKQLTFCGVFLRRRH